MRRQRCQAYLIRELLLRQSILFMRVQKKCCEFDSLTIGLLFLSASCLIANLLIGYGFNSVSGCKTPHLYTTHPTSDGQFILHFHCLELHFAI